MSSIWTAQFIEILLLAIDHCEATMWQLILAIMLMSLAASCASVSETTGKKTEAELDALRIGSRRESGIIQENAIAVSGRMLGALNIVNNEMKNNQCGEEFLVRHIYYLEESNDNFLIMVEPRSYWVEPTSRGGVSENVTISAGVNVGTYDGCFLKFTLRKLDLAVIAVEDYR